MSFVFHFFEVTEIFIGVDLELNVLKQKRAGVLFCERVSASEIRSKKDAGRFCLDFEFRSIDYVFSMPIFAVSSSKVTSPCASCFTGSGNKASAKVPDKITASCADKALAIKSLSV